MSVQPKVYVAGHRGMVGSAIVCPLHVGWKARTSLQEGIQLAYQDFQKNIEL